MFHPLPFWGFPAPESPFSTNVLHTASTKAQAARTPNDERNEGRQSTTHQREGDWQEVEGSRGRGDEANLDARNNRIAGRSTTGGTEVSEQALVSESNGITGRAQVNEKGPGAGDRGDREDAAYFGTLAPRIARRRSVSVLFGIKKFRRQKPAERIHGGQRGT